MKVAKWGNSLAVRLPKTVVDALELKEGDDVKVTLTGTRDLAVERADAERIAFLQRLKRFRGLLPADFKIDRDEANSRD